MARNLLSDSTLRAIKKDGLRRRLSDGAGLYLPPHVRSGSHSSHGGAPRRRRAGMSACPSAHAPERIAVADARFEVATLRSRGHEPFNRPVGHVFVDVDRAGPELDFEQLVVAVVADRPEVG